MEEKETLLKQFSIILSIYFLGVLFQETSGLPVPGNVMGMLILFFGLYTGVIKLEMIDKISDFLLENLAFFFLPAGVSLMTSFGLLEGKWTSILEISLISTLVTLVVTGLTVEFVKNSLRQKAESSTGNNNKKDNEKVYEKNNMKKVEKNCEKKAEDYLKEIQKELKRDQQEVHV